MAKKFVIFVVVAPRRSLLLFCLDVKRFWNKFLYFLNIYRENNKNFFFCCFVFIYVFFLYIQKKKETQN